jgi:hypothetical protein
MGRRQIRGYHDARGESYSVFHNYTCLKVSLVRRDTLAKFPALRPLCAATVWFAFSVYLFHGEINMITVIYSLDYGLARQNRSAVGAQPRDADAGRGTGKRARQAVRGRTCGG